jgi:hypothetical protein
MLILCRLKETNGMSRAGYSDDIDQWEMIKWRGQVASAVRGKRGQKLLHEMVQALDAMPTKRLIKEELETIEGDVCALGAVGKLRQVNMAEIDPEDAEQVAKTFDVAEQLAQEVMYMNDEWVKRETPEECWTRMRAWAISLLHNPPVGASI